MKAEHTRRALLVAAASGSLLAGCKGIAALGPVPPPGPDVITLEHAIASEELMIARYRAALTALVRQGRHPDLVAGLLTEHSRHLAALRSRLVLPPRLATERPRPSPTPPPVPAGHAQVLDYLAAAERAAAARLLGQLQHVPAPLAQLMASIGACEAAHAALLGGTRPA